MFKRSVVVLLSLSLTSCVAHYRVQNPPAAAAQPKEIVQHGETRVDPYFWLRDKENKEVIEFLNKENAYAEARLKPLKELQDTIYDEIVSRIKESDESVPAKKGPYYYYSRTEKGKNYGIYCRKKDSLDAEEEIILDVNDLAKGKDYVGLGGVGVSPNHKLLAYAADYEGDEHYILYIKDLETGETRQEFKKPFSGNFVWAADNKTVFYTIEDKARRPYRLYRHAMAGNEESDVLIFEENDPQFYMGIGKSKTDDYIFLFIGSKKTSEQHYLKADNPTGKFKLFEPRKQDHEYRVYHHRDQWFVRTNDKAKNFKIMTAPINRPQKKYWRTFLPYQPDVRVGFIEVFKDYIAINERRDGLLSIRIVRLKDKLMHTIATDEAAYAMGTDTNHEYDTTTLRFSYESPVTPESWYDYSMNTRERILLKQSEVPGGFNPSLYQVDRVMVKARDGVEVPMTLVSSKDFKRNAGQPAYMYSYGSYGSSTDPVFSRSIFSLIDRGFLVAYPHIRGGGELGKPWHEQGRLLNKKNTFYDFIDCAEYLIAKGYAQKGRIAISGGSAGGLLMGAVTNMRPDLWGVVVARVPFVDVLNTMSDPSLPLTVLEYEEWGNPEDKTYYDYIKSYSPYDNITTQSYPAILATAGLNDPRVGFWEPAKWVLRLRDRNTSNHEVLLRTEMGAGHFGPSGRYPHIRKAALYYAFMVEQLKTQPNTLK